MTTKATPAKRIADAMGFDDDGIIRTPKVDPLAHVNMILDAESPAPRQTTTIPTVMEQSKKLSEMMDGIADPGEFGTLHNEIEAEMAKIATVGTESERSKGTNPEPVKLPPFRPDSPRKAEPKAPKEAPVHDYEARTPGRRRGRGAGNQQAPINLPANTVTGGTTALNGEHVASLLKMTHAVGATVLGPAFSISDESARAIGDAALPVLEDFGVAVASRAVHLLMLVSTVAMIEGPIMLTVYADMKARAESQRSGFSTMAMGGGMHNAFPEGADPDEVVNAVSRATGVMVGNAS